MKRIVLIICCLTFVIFGVYVVNEGIDRIKISHEARWISRYGGSRDWSDSAHELIDLINESEGLSISDGDWVKVVSQNKAERDDIVYFSRKRAFGKVAVISRDHYIIFASRDILDGLNPEA